MPDVKHLNENIGRTIQDEKGQLVDDDLEKYGSQHNLDIHGLCLLQIIRELKKLNKDI